MSVTRSCCARLSLPLCFQSVILPRFNADETLSAIGSAKITTLVGVPTVHWLLLAQMKLKDYDLRSLKNIMYGGAPASPELVRKLRGACDLLLR